MNPTFQLILLPGLGADSRLFEPQRKAFPELVVPPWIPPRKHETLPDYAVRMAESIVPLPNVPLILGGVSFGGMMAYEMARHLRPDAVVQIASCRTRRALGNLGRTGRWLLPMLPVQTWNLAKWMSPAVRFYSRLQPVDREMLVTMFKEMDSGFMHWVLEAILNWDPRPLEGVRVFQIHGGRDPLISVRHVQADQIIPQGGHMINFSHAEEVNSFIRKAADFCISAQTNA
jgi:pimeloyl-ACP methyl ester carboxylesterase